MEFRILGPLEIRDGGEEVQFRGPKQRGLLAVLLLNANRVVALDRLVDELWENPPTTAAQAVQVYVSKLRKLFASAEPGAPRVLTRSPGYMLEVEPGTVDLHRFESLVEAGRRALDLGDAVAAAAQLGEALDLRRGPVLDGFVEEPFAQPARARLEELQLTAREWRSEADLALGRHAELIGELKKLVGENPLRERIRGQLMLALYRSGRQAEALEVYHETRALLVEELGLEPSQVLQQLERAILVQDPALELPVASAPTVVPASLPDQANEDATRALLVGAVDDEPLDGLLWLARPLAAAEPHHELIVIRLVDAAAMEVGFLSRAAAELDALRMDLGGIGLSARAAAFTSTEPSDDFLRLSSEQGVDLVLLDGGQLLDDDRAALTPLLEGSPCDVALLLRSDGQRLLLDADHLPLVVFGGSDDDWAALELGTWLARGAGTSLRLAGTAANEARGRRDASRLLATASLVVQRFAGVSVEPVLAAPGSDGVLAAAKEAGVVVIGFGERGRHRLGVGHVRIAREAAVPTLFVSRGLRPGGLAPEGLTRYTWSLSGEEAAAASR